MDENLIDEEVREQHLEESRRLQFWVTGGLFFIVICIVFPPAFIIGALTGIFIGIVGFAVQVIACLIKKIPASTVFLLIKKHYVSAKINTLIFAKKYKQDWFRYTLLIILALIATALLKIAF